MFSSAAAGFTVLTGMTKRGGMRVCIPGWVPGARGYAVIAYARVNPGKQIPEDDCLPSKDILDSTFGVIFLS